MGETVATPDSVIIRVDAQAPVPDKVALPKTKVKTYGHHPDDIPSYKDSDTLINNTERIHWVRHIWKNVIFICFLCIFGFALVVTGIIVEVKESEHTRAALFIGAGGLCLIPGLYHIIYLICIKLGRQGYELRNLPIFNTMD